MEQAFPKPDCYSCENDAKSCNLKQYFFQKFIEKDKKKKILKHVNLCNKNKTINTEFQQYILNQMKQPYGNTNDIPCPNLKFRHGVRDYGKHRWRFV